MRTIKTFKYLNVNSLFILSFILFLGGCATTATYSDMTRDVDFNQYETYAWLPPNGDTINTTQRQLFDNEILNEKIMAEVNEEMRMRGYQIDAENPDLLVKIHTAFEQKKEKEPEPIYSTYDYYYPNFYYSGAWYPYYYGGYTGISRISGYEMETIRYTEGMIAIDIIETANSKLVWRGWVEDRINRQTLTNDVRDYIDNIFDEFPIKVSYDKDGRTVSR